MRLRPLLLVVVVVAAVAAIAGGAWVVWRVRYPVSTDADRIAFEARSLRLDDAVERAKERPPLTGPAIEEDGADVIEAAIPADYHALNILRTAWRNVMEGRPFTDPQRQTLDALAPQLSTVRDAIRGATHNDWEMPRNDAPAYLAANAMLLIALDDAHRTGRSCLPVAIEALQLQADQSEQAMPWQLPMTWAFERCTRLAPVEERRRAAREAAQIQRYATQPGLIAEMEVVASLMFVADAPPPDVTIRDPLVWWYDRRAYSTSVREVHAVLERGPDTLYALDATCMPDCARTLLLDPSLTATERRGIEVARRSVVGALAHFRLIAAMVALAAGEPASEVAARFPDPYGGAPYRETTIDGRRAIYFVGRNARDDHGGADDMVARLPP